jgi:hypothetical protein
LVIVNVALYFLPEETTLDCVKKALELPVKLAEPPDIVIPTPLVQLLSVEKSPLVTSSEPYKFSFGFTLNSWCK